MKYFIFVVVAITMFLVGFYGTEYIKNSIVEDTVVKMEEESNPFPSPMLPEKAKRAIDFMVHLEDYTDDELTKIVGIIEQELEVRKLEKEIEEKTGKKFGRPN